MITELPETRVAVVIGTAETAAVVTELIVEVPAGPTLVETAVKVTLVGTETAAVVAAAAAAAVVVVDAVATASLRSKVIREGKMGRKVA